MKKAKIIVGRNIVANIVHEAQRSVYLSQTLHAGSVSLSHSPTLKIDTACPAGKQRTQVFDKKLSNLSLHTGLCRGAHFGPYMC